MTYQVLARKYRPQNFQEIVGQEHVVQALVNGIENDRLHHAFLFTGTRGVGKTTLARVLAKSLNCLEGVSGNPCGMCQHCEEIKRGEFIDLIEVDAASRTGVDDTRSLLENVQYAPNKGNYKIYLIDEVHMFSKSSFNALLKTLEEPPPHVKFLLATTEPDKLPVTVLSRCLQFNLKRLTQKQISDHLQKLLNLEAIPYDDKGIHLIARVADGSMRDALSLLDQSLAFGAGEIKFDEIRSMLGTVEQSHVEELLALVHENNTAGLVEKLEWFHDMSIDYSQLLDDLCHLLHEISTIQSLGKIIGSGNFDVRTLQDLSQSLTPEEVQWFYQLTIVAIEQLAVTPNKKVSFEMAVIRMLDFDLLNDTATGQKKTIEFGSIEQTTVSNTENKQIISSVPANESSVQQQDQTTTQKINLSELTADKWPEVFQQIQLKGGARELARHMALLENTNKIITFAVDDSAELFLTEKSQKTIREKLLSGSEGFQIKFALKNQVVSLAQKEKSERQQQEKKLQQVDSVIEQLQNQFGAEIIEHKLGD
ncbi:MAG: DNA polymerase III subunit gamma/tau [Marinicella sp.]